MSSQYFDTIQMSKSINFLNQLGKEEFIVLFFPPLQESNMAIMSQKSGFVPRYRSGSRKAAAERLASVKTTNNCRN